MGPINYLEQILFYNQSTATDETLKERSSEIFEKVEAESFAEIHVQSHHSDSSSPSSLNPRKWSVRLDVEVASNPPPPVDHYGYPVRDLPCYVGSPGLLRQRNSSSSQELEKIIESVR